MKKAIAFVLICTLIMSFTACSSSLEDAMQEAISSIPDELLQESSNANAQGENSGETSEPSSSGPAQSGNMESSNIDYSPYSALVKAYTLDYNIENVSATDYVVTGMTLTHTYPQTPEDSMMDASGFCYANLIDLDGNGVLELILIGYDEQDWDETAYEIYGDKIKISLLDDRNIAKVYTINPEAGLEFLGGIPLSELFLPTSFNYGIEYIVSENKAYIAVYDIFQMGDGTIYYYGINDGYFGVQAYFEMNVHGGSVYEDVEYNAEETQKLKDSFGTSEVHIIENMNDDMIAELEAINAKTFDFLANYPVQNFVSVNGAYNNGQFCFIEYAFQDFYPPNIAIQNYFNALTMQDYDALAELGISAEEIDDIEMRRSPEEDFAYIPGYIISDLEIAITDLIENPELSSDIEEYINSLPYSNITLIYCNVNEVLDPHTSQLGLQIAGGTYDYYFVLYSEDSNGLNWKIAEIFDDKFYW